MYTAFEFSLQTPAPLPQDNGYLLLSALSQKFPFLHGSGEVQIAPLRGTRTETNKVLLDRCSTLHIRGITAGQAAKIGGSWVSILNVPLCIGDGKPKTLVPSPYLASKLVVFEGLVVEDTFMAKVGALIPEGVQVSLGKRRCLRVKGQAHLGYAVHLSNLPAEVSLALQAKGMGKHRSMGCGVFYPGTRSHL